MNELVPDRYTLAFRLYPYTRSPDQDATSPVRRTVVISGAGPVGLATALDLGQRGVPVVVLDDHEGPGLGSRALCFAKRTLEICDRLGAVQLSSRGIETVRRLIRGEAVDQAQSGMSAREWRELMTLLGRDGAA